MRALYDLRTDDVLATVLAEHGDVLGHLQVAWVAAWSSVDPRTLELCRLHVASMLGCQHERAARTPFAVAAGFDEHKAAALDRWYSSDRFTPAERACLAFTEAFVMDVASLDDDCAEAVRVELGDTGLVNFTNALLVIEQRQRLRQIWERLFGGTA